MGSISQKGLDRDSSDEEIKNSTVMKDLPHENTLRMLGLTSLEERKFRDFVQMHSDSEFADFGQNHLKLLFFNENCYSG